MKLPEIQKRKAKPAELIAATYHNTQSVRLKAGSCPPEILPEGTKGTDWVYIRPKPTLTYSAPTFYTPMHGKVIHRGMHLFLRDFWPKYRRVDDYLKDIFFFKENTNKDVHPKSKQNDSKTIKNHFHKRSDAGKKQQSLLCC